MAQDFFLELIRQFFLYLPNVTLTQTNVTGTKTKEQLRNEFKNHILLTGKLVLKYDAKSRSFCQLFNIFNKFRLV